MRERERVCVCACVRVCDSQGLEKRSEEVKCVRVACTVPVCRKCEEGKDRDREPQTYIQKKGEFVRVCAYQKESERQSVRQVCVCECVCFWVSAQYVNILRLTLFYV